MVTVVDIDPASLALTPGQADTFTLTVRNDGDDVEAYHLSAVGDAADQVAIEPETLLVHPGETGTATASITLAHGGGWPVGDLVLRFEVAPATHPDDLVAVEAIVSVRSFSEVDAVLSPTALEGRRGDTTEISIANSGNTHAYADVVVSAGELTVAMDRPRVTIPAGSTESVELGLRAPKFLWRGDPVAHPFFVTVTPEESPAVPLEGTFTQVPVFSRWALIAALGAAGVLVVVVAVWLAALAWSNAVSPVAASPSPTPTETSVPPVVDVAVELVADDLGQAGDTAVAVLDAEVEVDELPDGALLAVEVEWPDELGLADSTCETWAAPENDRELEGRPRSGDECLIDPTSSRSRAELAFATPPAGFSGEIAATATRLVTLDGGEVEEVETDAGSDFGETDLAIELQPYPFWLEVVIADEPEFDGAPRQATIGVHRTLARDGTDESARMAFELLLPGFAELSFMEGCDGIGANAATCVLFFPSDLEFWSVTATFEAREDPPDAGPVSAAGVELSFGDVPVPPSEVGEMIRGADALLISAADLFPVDVELDTDEAQAGEAVTATVAVTYTPLPSDVDEFREGSWVLGVELSWPEALVLDGDPSGCASFDRGICRLPGPADGDRAVITLAFTVADDAFQNGDVTARGASLVYDPTSEADGRDGREQTPVEMPREWIGSDEETFFPF